MAYLTLNTAILGPSSDIRTIEVCGRTGAIQKVNGRTVVYASNSYELAVRHSWYENRPEVVQYDGMSYVTVSGEPKGYICNSGRCYC